MASGYSRRSTGAGFSSLPRGHSRGRGRGGRGGRGGGRPFHGGGSRFGGNTVVFGFNSLQKLREADPDDIVLDLASERCLPAFRELLKKTDMGDEMIELTLHVLARACDSNSPEYFNKLLVELPRSLFVMINLKGYIARMCMRRNTRSDAQLFIENTVKLFGEILKRIPDAFASLPLGDLEQTVDFLKATGQIGPEVTQSAEQLKAIKKESLEKEIRRREREQQRMRSRRSGMSVETLLGGFYIQGVSKNANH
jgi:hypothetical protein